MGLLNDNDILLFIAISLQGFFSVGIFLVVKFRQIENFVLFKEVQEGSKTHFFLPCSA